MPVELTGLESVIKNLNKQIKNITAGSMAGLIRANIIVRRSMEAESPKIPIDTGNLRASYFAITSTGMTPQGASPSFKGENAEKMSIQHSEVLSNAKGEIASSRLPLLILGFTANYAWKVHESVGTKFKRPGSGAKFLEAALKRNHQKILKVIQESARIK